MNRWAVAGLALAVVAGLWWWRSSMSHDPAAVRHDPPPAALGAASGGAATPAARTPVELPPTRVIRLANAIEQRRLIADRIAAARARRAASAAPAAGASPAQPGSGSEMDTPDHVLTQMKSAFEEVKEYVTECVERSGSKVSGFKADLRLTGDPDVGTLIDASALESTDGKPLPVAFDGCVREIMQTLELPPMGLGAEFKVSYVFALTSEPSLRR